MHKLQILLFILLFGYTFNSCNRHDDVAIEIYNRWEVVDFISVESILYAKDNDFNPVIQFQKNGCYTLQLDVNNCTESFSLSGNEGIEITAAGCTKICCDSDFSNKITEMLAQVDSYSIEKNKMKLNVSGWGWINLELNN